MIQSSRRPDGGLGVAKGGGSGLLIKSCRILVTRIGGDKQERAREGKKPHCRAVPCA